MSFHLNHKTFLQHVLDTELSEFQYKFNPDTLLAGIDEPVYVDCSILAKTLPKKESFQRLIRHYKCVAPSEINFVENYREFFQTLTNSIHTIEVSNLSAALQSIYNIQQKLGDLFYGALIISGNKIINPLHPLVAITLASGKVNNFTSKVKVAIYAYGNKYIRKDMEKLTEDSRANMDLITKNINSQIQCYANQVRDTKVKILESNALRNSAIQVKYQLSKHPDEEDDMEYFLIPNQMLTSGIVMPYYGTTAIRMNGGTGGMNVTPMLSCNIGHEDFYINSNSECNVHIEGTTNYENISLEWQSVCTGNLSNRTFKGLRTLIHSNTLSPYNTNILRPGAISYADKCVEKSIQILKLANLIKEDTNVKENQTTEQHRLLFSTEDENPGY